MKMNKKWIGFLIGLTCFSTQIWAVSDEVMLLNKVTSSSTQQNMSPKEALLRLKEGNQRFLSNTMVKRDLIGQAKNASYGQYPWAVILNCMDSRSVPELFFDQGLADLFTIRVAGNVLNKDILGSMEFATKVAGAKLIVVLGHTSCGAVAGACHDVNLGHLDNVLDKIKPVIATSKNEAATTDCNKAELIDIIAKNNAMSVANQIQEQSPIIKDLLAKKQIGIVAGVHDIKSGKVTFFNEGRFVPLN